MAANPSSAWRSAPGRDATVTSATFRLAEDAALLFMGGRRLLFSEARQKLFDLNDAAAYLACRLESGITHEALLDELPAGETREAIAAAIRAMLLDWSRQGLAVAELPSADPIAERSQTIAMADTVAAIRYATPALAMRLGPIFTQIESGAARVENVWRVAESPDFAFIGHAGAPARIVGPRQSGPALKALLVEELLHRTEAFTALHGACLVGDDGGAILLCGSPGTGKSTLTAALDAAGFGYDGDDITLLDHAGRVQGVPFAITAKAGAWPLIENVRPDIRRLPVHQRLDARRVRYLPALNVVEPDWRPLRHIVRLRRKPAAVAALHPRDPADALSDLMDEAWSRAGRTGVRDMEMLVRTVSAARCHELIYSDLGDAVRLLDRACRHG